MTGTSPDEHSQTAESTDDELERAREELARQLEEACASGIGQLPGETTGQLRRLDDALLAAARAAEGMIALKQRARAEREGGDAAGAGGAAGSASIGGAPGADSATIDAHVERIREFRDQHDCLWRAWAVTPGQASTSSTRNLGELRNGWLAFESLTGSGKRRLIDFPADWMMMSDEDLEALLERAADAPQRKRASGHDAPSPD
ncbi:MAG: hypothetical protein ACJ79K_01320 [Gemmatimonadaceae bacterium]